MRTLSSLAVVLIALAVLWADAVIAAPLPQDKPPLSIDGKYVLVSISSVGPGGRVLKGAPGGVAKGGGGAAVGGRVMVPSASLLGSTTITKNEIAIDGRNTTMEYTLDATKMTIDVDVVNLRGKKSRSLGLVEVNGNHLIIALAKEGDERPKTTEEADGVTVYYFQKAPPPPRTEFRIVAMTVGKEEVAEKELNKLAQDGFEFVSTTQPAAADARSSVTTVHFLLKRTVKQP